MARRRDDTDNNDALARLVGSDETAPAERPGPSLNDLTAPPGVLDVAGGGPGGGRSSESPRERGGGLFNKPPQLRAPGPSGPVFSPSPPMAPTPTPNQVSAGTSGAPPPTSSAGPEGLMPFTPLPSPTSHTMTGTPDVGMGGPTSQLRGLFGGAGGTTGGGLGVPGSPSAAQPFDISALIQALMGQMRQQ